MTLCPRICRRWGSRGLLLGILLLSGCGTTTPPSGVPFEDTGAPTVVIPIRPANNQKDVPVNTVISATFSEPMDPATLTTTTFIVSTGESNIPGTVTYSGITATFTPAAALDGITTYLVTITTRAKDMVGNRLATNFVWQFTTGALPLIAPPILNVRFETKRLIFSWNTTGIVDFYRLMEDPDGPGPDGVFGFTQVGTDIPGHLDTTHLDIAVHQINWQRARYRLSACNVIGCIHSNEVMVIEGMLQTIGYFKASNTGVNDAFGLSLSLSKDGNTLAVGAHLEDSNAMGTATTAADQANNAAIDSGAVYLFTRTGGLWRQQAYIKASNTNAGDFFGDEVSLSNDGSTLAVGATEESSNAKGVNKGVQSDNTATSSGAVYIFTRTGEAWSQQAYVKASNTAAYDLFGSSVALSGDGNTLAVGAKEESSAARGIITNMTKVPTDADAASSGAAYLFTRTGTEWSQQAYMKASNREEDSLFGGAVSLSDDGNTLAVGSEGENSAAIGVNGNPFAIDPITREPVDSSGAVYLFTRTGMDLSQQAYVKASNTDESDLFGNSVALSGDGNTLAVGAIGEESNVTGINQNQDNDDLSTGFGAVYLFVRDVTANEWSQQAYIKSSNTTEESFFGSSVSLSKDGNTLAVGSNEENSAATGINGNQTDYTATSSGAVYLFTRTGTEWLQKSYLKAPNTGSNDCFGVSASLSENGNTLAVGAAGNNRGESSAATGINGDQSNNMANASGAVYLY